MTIILRPDLCVIGGGPGGIAAARAAAQLGAQVVLVEKHALTGTEHLRHAWQSEALKALATRLAAVRSGARVGGAESAARIDFKHLRRATEASVHRLMRQDSPERLTALNIRIIPAIGTFTSRARLEAGEFIIEAWRFLLATSTVPAPLAVPGAELVRPLTPDRIDDLATVPKKLVVMGTSHESLVLAQTFLRLGSQVTLLRSGAFLQSADPELAAALHHALREEGMAILENVTVRGIELPGPKLQAAGLKVLLGNGATIDASHFIHADRRVSAVEGLGLEAAHVFYAKAGVRRNADLRSSNPRIYAINDGLESVHSIASARREAEWVVQLLFGQSRPRPLQVAHVIGTDPEIAVIGLSEQAARAKHRKIRVFRAAFCDNLRAQTVATHPPHPDIAGKTPVGHVKIITDRRGYLLGAGVVGPQARELIGIFGLGLARRLKIDDLAVLAADVPTLMDVCRTAALASAPQTGKVKRRRIFSIWRSLR
ncbi:FAD-dependent oxidoreductase [Methylovirgula sp. HY1]|uniref:FAD-dependent oxidoreductase n=1 Tax=Methylovirgula sp. HY1 TaxID=2822761 RepID=UPI001C5ADD9D|nr:FAD-dependent oxidoreductase [Methylovirgula sp. HY1]QXX76163.1 Dihydrolipoyl dehydrogenase [Methylovirgula sp. HY1]